LASIIKSEFLEKLTARYGQCRRINGSQSLFDVSDGQLRVYVRYSKRHARDSTFYGLRAIDLGLLEGHPSVLCFLWDDQSVPLLIPFSEFEDLFRTVSPASDGQYKIQIYTREEATELYLASAGRFNVESYYGWDAADMLCKRKESDMPVLSHSQVQTLIGSLGARKGYAVWIPANDRSKMDWTLASPFDCARTPPLGVMEIREVVQEIDVIWMDKGASKARAFFEVEHSTPIYSALLRFNDVLILSPQSDARYSIVSNEDRRSLFVRQLNRPTFCASGLDNACSFLEYRNVFLWHKRVTS